ncbi:MAG: hypothetical protein H0V23_13185 [Nocardioidaceae bacterium]|nr:hypothetical protein [Nocardioidaceae bacterium]
MRGKPERSRDERSADVGELLPTLTSDETNDGWGEPTPDRDEELRREVPPHHS